MWVAFSAGSMPCAPAPTPQPRTEGLSPASSRAGSCDRRVPSAPPLSSCRGVLRVLWGLGVHHAACSITFMCLPAVGPNGDRRPDQRLGVLTRQLPCALDPGATHIRAAWGPPARGACPRADFLLCFFLMTFFFSLQLPLLREYNT